MPTATTPFRALSKHLTCFSAICLALLSAASARAQTPWLNQDYSDYTVGDFVGTNNTPSLISSVPSNNVIVDVSGNKKARYFKAAASSGLGTIYKLSDNLSTDRPKGYFSFKATMGTNAGTNGSYMIYTLGANDSNSVAPAASQYLQIRLYYANTTTNQLRIYSGSGNTNNPAQVFPASGYSTLPTNENTFQVWYNKTASPMGYTNPSGISNNLNTNSFVVYINGALYGSNASSTGTLPTSVTTSNATTGANSVSTIGKLGWLPGNSSQAYDITFDNVYAADSAPGVSVAPSITSATNVSAPLEVPFTYQITTDPPGATSYALTGKLPDGLEFNSATGVINGIPTTVGGPTVVSISASNSVGTGPSVNLSISVLYPVNVFSGSNPSLNTPASWSLGSMPTGSANPGSFTDLVFNSTATNLTTTAGNIYGKSWNVTNGGNYTFSSTNADGQTSFKLGNTGTVDTYPYYNAVVGASNVMLYLTNGSKLTFALTNTGAGGTNSLIALRNSGVVLIAEGSVADFQAPISAVSASNVLTKAGNGTLILGASNSCSGGIVVSNGTVNATAANSLGAGAVTVDGGLVDVSADNAWTGSKALGINGGVAAFSSSNNYTGITTLSGGTLRLSNAAALGTTNTAGTFKLAGGIVEALADYDLGHAFGTATNNGTNSWVKLDGQTTTISGPVTLNAAPGVTLALYKLAGTTNSANTVTKTGSGTLQLRGGGVPSLTADWSINDGTLFINTTASGGLGTNNYVILNGGNILMSKGAGSTGNYTGQGQDAGLRLQQNGMIILNPNTNTAPGANTASFTNLVISNQTLTVLKGAEAFCSTNPGYTDPRISFAGAALNGSATILVGTNMETVLQAGTGPGGVTKTGAGKLTISSGSVVTNSVTNSVPNTYTDPTTVDAGTLQLGGIHASSITIGANAVLESTLATNNPVTSGSLAFAGGAKVRIAGTPDGTSAYTLVTASSGITGTPTLESAIVGYTLATIGNSLILTTAVPTTPTIAVTGSFTNFSTTIGAPSAAQTVSASGSDLTTSITVTPPAGYEVSTDGTSYNASLSLTPSGGVLASTTVYVRLTGAAVGSFPGNVSFASTGASTQSVPVTGSVVSLYDSWASGYGLSGTNAATTADPDLDGFNNNSEYYFDGNPTNSTPYLLRVTPSSTNAVFNWIQRNSGVSYEVQTNSTLTNVWTGPAAVTISNSANQSGVLLTNDYMRKEFIVPASGKSFYRVKATIAP